MSQFIKYSELELSSQIAYLMCLNSLFVACILINLKLFMTSYFIRTQLAISEDMSSNASMINCLVDYCLRSATRSSFMWTLGFFNVKVIDRNSGHYVHCLTLKTKIMLGYTQHFYKWSNQYFLPLMYEITPSRYNIGTITTNKMLIADSAKLMLELFTIIFFQLFLFIFFVEFGDAEVI